jgi:hypothetical protein
MEIIHFELNKITNLKPYLSIELSNSKACGNIYIGITDNQTTFYYRFFVERGIEKLNKKMKFYIYKTDKNNMFCSLESKENLELIFVVENEKIVFSENLPFSELYNYHKENKKDRVEKIFSDRKKIEERKEKERLERESLETKEVEKNNKNIIKFTYYSMILTLDNYFSDYGNRDIDLCGYDVEEVSELHEDQAKDVFYENGGDVDVIQATIESEGEYCDDDLNEEFKLLNKEDQEKITKKLLELAEKLGIEF